LRIHTNPNSRRNRNLKKEGLSNGVHNEPTSNGGSSDGVTSGTQNGTSPLAVKTSLTKFNPTDAPEKPSLVTAMAANLSNDASMSSSPIAIPLSNDVLSPPRTFAIPQPHLNRSSSYNNNSGDSISTDENPPSNIDILAQTASQELQNMKSSNSSLNGLQPPSLKDMQSHKSLPSLSDYFGNRKNVIQPKFTGVATFQPDLHHLSSLASSAKSQSFTNLNRMKLTSLDDNRFNEHNLRLKKSRPNSPIPSIPHSPVLTGANTPLMSASSSFTNLSSMFMTPAFPRPQTPMSSQVAQEPTTPDMNNTNITTPKLSPKNALPSIRSLNLELPTDLNISKRRSFSATSGKSGQFKRLLDE
jgi:hypothetical protein